MKTEINYTDNLNILLDKYSQFDTIIISENHQLKSSTNIQVFSMKELCEYLLKKSPLLVFPTILSEVECKILIQSIIEETFAVHPALKNLTKSTNFSKFLYKLFNSFFLFEISSQKLQEIIFALNLKDDDNARLKLIAYSYQLFEKTLIEQNFLTIGSLYKFIIDLFKKYPQLQEITKENARNILIDEELELYPIEINLLRTINSNIIYTQFQEKIENIASEIISKKYLKTKLNCPNQKTEIKLYELDDILDEAKFIASDIIEKINNKNYQPSDFTIALNNYNSFKIFNDTLNQAGIETNLSNQDSSFHNFFVKLTQYLQICSNLKKLNSQKIISKFEQEKIYEEVNLYFENIISETLNNQFIKDKFLKILEASNKLSLIDCVRENIKILTSVEQEKIQKEINKIEELSTLYNSLKLSLFVGLAVQGIENLSTNSNVAIARLIKKISLIEKFFIKIKKITLNNQEILELFNFQDLSKNENSNCVKIILTSEQPQAKKVLYLADSTDKSMANNLNQIHFVSYDVSEKLSQEIKKIHPSFKNIIETTTEQIQKSAQKLTNILAQNYEEIIFTTHKYEEKKQIQASIFFETLASIIPIKEKNILKSENKTTIEESEIATNTKALAEEKLVIEENETLQLSASAISNFQTCPRKYYFSNLIGLKSQSTFAANYGTIVHCVFELFNKKYINSYNKETLQKLAEILFDSNKNPQLALDAGFSQRNIDLICATDSLGLEDMSAQLSDVINILDNIGFFNKIPDEVICEKSFKFTHPSIPNVVFDGRIDAIYKFNDSYIIVDFKTGANKPELNYLISENGVTFKTPTGKEASNVEAKQKEYEYQIPIYYFASKYSDDFKEIKENIEKIGLQYIRPKNKNQGYKEDFISCSSIEEFEEQIIENLKTTIIDKIKNKTHFEPQINERICKSCSFKCLCEEKNEEENESND